MKAAELGHLKAQIKLGVYHFYGRPLDRETAIVWLQRAAVTGSKDAQLTLGTAYDTGNLETENLVKAYAWYWLASDYNLWNFNRFREGVREHGMKKLDERMSNEEVTQAMRMVAQLKKQFKSIDSEN